MCQYRLGLQIDARFDYELLISHVSRAHAHEDLEPFLDKRWALNPTHYFWDTLLELGSPFVKVELLRWNPGGRPHLQEIVDLLPAEETQLIRGHLSRVDHATNATLMR